MKKLHYVLAFLLLGINLSAQETEKLPEVPWADIVEMNNNTDTPITRWKTDINIKLEGLYTQADSLEVVRIVKKLDSITENITINFSNKEESNLRIHFLDTLVKDEHNNIIDGYSYSLESGYRNSYLYVYEIDQTDVEARNTLESKIAKELVSGSFIFRTRGRKRSSIFNPLVANSNRNYPLNKGDIEIIKEVYGKNYENQLKVAEEQFEFVIQDLRNEEFFQRKEALWWAKNPISILVLPTIILLLVVVFIVTKINKGLSHKIKNDWLRFGVVSFIALTFIYILIVQKYLKSY